VRLITSHMHNYCDGSPSSVIPLGHAPARAGMDIHQLDAHQCLAMLQFRDRQFAQFELLQTENAFVHGLAKIHCRYVLVIQRSP